MNANRPAFLVAIAVAIVWITIGAIVVFRKEMKLSGKKLKEIRAKGYAERSYLFQRTSGLWSMIILWPVTIFLISGEPKDKTDADNPGSGKGQS